MNTTAAVAGVHRHFASLREAVPDILVFAQPEGQPERDDHVAADVITASESPWTAPFDEEAEELPRWLAEGYYHGLVLPRGAHRSVRAGWTNDYRAAFRPAARHGDRTPEAGVVDHARGP
ncbi:hypothetical protein GCM10010320_03780 [Streptomyces caelestis]|nr:hypothetical protein GCM10010320_03780 [Streptomyces caelestis]